MTDESKIAEQVAERLEGKKLFTVSSKETIYYYREVYAIDAEDADDICSSSGEWGEASDSSDFEVTSITENVGVK
jgi:hypothetical protein